MTAFSDEVVSKVQHLVRSMIEFLEIEAEGLEKGEKLNLYLNSVTFMLEEVINNFVDVEKQYIVKQNVREVLKMRLGKNADN